MKYVIALCLFALTYADNEFCQLKPETGPCKAYFPSYYYDAETQECRQFVYGGCQGNENRFKTQEQCEEACGAQRSNEAICHLEPEKGMCLAYMPRYYYNAKEGKCIRFIYGGCQGNPNNFKTLEECETRCATQSSDVPVCEQEPETGLCRGYFPRYYYDKETGKCSVFVYGGCGGNKNNFANEEECLQKCDVQQTSVPVCEQEAKPGRCLAYMPRYYYDKTSGQCKRFIYGGCEGNENNFKTIEECEDTCQVVEAESVCGLAAETGPCLAYFVRYYFNQDSGECETFVYGGCKGNGNNFKTEEECHKMCSAQSAVSICDQERHTGPCRGFFPRYYYNKESGTCERFIYGGCQANDNNFETVEECQHACGDF